MPKKKSVKTPRPHHVWAINPKTRVTPSRKNDSKKDQALRKHWVDELFD